MESSFGLPVFETEQGLLTTEQVNGGESAVGSEEIGDEASFWETSGREISGGTTTPLSLDVDSSRLP